MDPDHPRVLQHPQLPPSPLTLQIQPPRHQVRLHLLLRRPSAAQLAADQPQVLRHSRRRVLERGADQLRVGELGAAGEGGGVRGLDREDQLRQSRVREQE